MTQEFFGYWKQETFQKQIQRMQVEMDALKMERAADKETSQMELQAWMEKVIFITTGSVSFSPWSVHTQLSVI